MRCWFKSVGLLAVVIVVFGYVPAAASGSIGAGGSKAGARGEYTLGKAVVHRSLVCRRGCPIGRRQFNAVRASALAEEIAGVLSGGQPNEMIRALCAAGDRGDCAERLRAVQTYIKRRFRL